jgi:hypothetical protein
MDKAGSRWWGVDMVSASGEPNRSGRHRSPGGDGDPAGYWSRVEESGEEPAPWRGHSGRHWLATEFFVHALDKVPAIGAGCTL